MPETALERYNARQAAREAIVEQFTADAAVRAVVFGKSPVCVDGRHDACVGLAPHRDFADCLCTCHDPKTTYWVWWGEFDGQREVVGMTSGPYDNVDDAIDDGLAGSVGDAAWIRSQRDLIEQITAERWDALTAWDEKTADEKDALRPAESENDDA